MRRDGTERNPSMAPRVTATCLAGGRAAWRCVAIAAALALVAGAGCERRLRRASQEPMGRGAEAARNSALAPMWLTDDILLYGPMKGRHDYSLAQVRLPDGRPEPVPAWSESLRDDLWPAKSLRSAFPARFGLPMCELAPGPRRVLWWNLFCPAAYGIVGLDGRKLGAVRQPDFATVDVCWEPSGERWVALEAIGPEQRLAWYAVGGGAKPRTRPVPSSVGHMVGVDIEGRAYTVRAVDDREPLRTLEIDRWRPNDRAGEPDARWRVAVPNRLSAVHTRLSPDCSRAAFAVNTAWTAKPPPPGSPARDRWPELLYDLYVWDLGAPSVVRLGSWRRPTRGCNVGVLRWLPSGKAVSFYYEDMISVLDVGARPL